MLWLTELWWWHSLPHMGNNKPRDPRFKAVIKLQFNARPSDLVALDLLVQKKRLDRTNVMRLALHHLAEFEGLSAKVEEKGNLLIGEGG